MLFYLLQIAFVLLFPALTLYAEKRFPQLRWLSPIVICYMAGILIGNLNLSLDKELLSLFTEISVSLAIPILLFSSNFLEWLKHSRLTFLSFFLGIISVVLSSIIAFLLFSGQFDQSWKVAGMLIGVYTGGTPNMSAIGLALEVEEEVFILLNSADLIFSGIYFIFLITFAQGFLGLFLPRFKGPANSNSEAPPMESNPSLEERIKNTLIAIGLSLLILGLAIGISHLITGEISAPIVILGITSLGIIFSFLKPVQNLKHTYQSAEYMLLVFAVAMGSLANIRELIEATTVIFYFCGVVMICSVFIHMLFAFLFKIDTDTLIITSTAGIFGPAFIGPVAEAIKNREIIVPGITMGLLGYALGNYLGLAVAWLLN